MHMYHMYSLLKLTNDSSFIYVFLHDSSVNSRTMLHFFTYVSRFWTIKFVMSPHSFLWMLSSQAVIF